MRAVTVTKQQFDEAVFPALIQGNAENESEMETAIRVLRKFRDPEVTQEETVSAEMRERAERMGQRVFALRRLVADTHTFELEEDEHRLLVARMKAHVPRVHLLAAEDFLAALAAVRDAPTQNGRPAVAQA